MWKFNQSLLKSFSFVVPLLLAFAGLGSTLVISTPARSQSTVRTNGNGTRVDITLNRQPNETYETLVNRAQTAARNTLTRSFNQNPSASRVSVTVLGQNSGQVVPIMSLSVNRQTWANGQDVARLARYFPNSRSLLGLGTPGTPNNNVAYQPQPTNVANAGQVLPNGVRVLPNGTVVTGNGVQVLPNGTVVTNNGGTQVLPNGNVVSEYTAVPGTPNTNTNNNSGNNGIGGFNTGVAPAPGSASGVIQTPGSGIGINQTPVQGNINGTTGIGGSAAGTTGIGGSAAGTTGIGGSAAGTTGIGGSAAGTTGIGGSATGTTGIGDVNGTTGVNGTGTTGVNGTGTTGVNGTGTTGVNGTGTTGVNGTGTTGVGGF